jgi:hypothetical protein
MASEGGDRIRLIGLTAALLSARSLVSTRLRRSRPVVLDALNVLIHKYFDYYRDYHAFWKLYGLDLPDIVLRKVYYGNALTLVHGLPAGDFPPVDGAGASGGR